MACALGTLCVLGATACGDESNTADAGPALPAPYDGSGGFGGTTAVMQGGSGGKAGGSGSAGSPGFMTSPCIPGEPCSCVACGAFGACKDCGAGCDCTNSGFMEPIPQTLPSPLPWVPPFDDVGEDGWRDSTEPLCSQLAQVFSVDVWSDSRGVFMLGSGFGLQQSLGAVGAMVAPPDEDAGTPISTGVFGVDPNSPVPRTQLWMNDGTGWSLVVDRSFQVGFFGLSGAEDGPLFLYQRPTSPTIQFELEQQVAPTKHCSLGVVRGKKLACEDLDAVTGLHVVGPDLTYAVVGETRLLEHDGTNWHAIPSLIPYPATAVWGDGTKLLVVGRVGTVFWQEQDGWKLQDAGTVDHFTELWGPTADDIWAGTARGEILHYDGEKWTSMGSLGGVTCDTQMPITGIWGSADQVYFHTDTELARWDGSELKTLANWTCTGGMQSGVRIGGLWGNAADEIFLGIVDGIRFDPGGCGATYVVYYDGETFHRM